MSAAPELNSLLDAVESQGGAPGPEVPTAAGNLEFPLEEFAFRCRRAAALLEAAGYDAMVLSQPANVRYFTGMQTWLWKPLVPTIAVLTRSPTEPMLLASSMDAAGVRASAWPGDVTFYGADQHPADALTALLRRANLAKGPIGFERGRGQLGYLTPEVISRLAASMPALDMVDAVPLCSAARMLKSELEIERLRTAARITAEGFGAALEAAQEGMTEIQLAQVATTAMVARGSLPAFAPLTLICRAGPGSYGQILQFAGEEEVRAGQQIFFDGGCEWRGYQTDIMRSGVLGEPSPALAEHFELLDAAVAVATEALTPGRPLGEVHGAVKQFASEHGLTPGDEPYGIGHGIGLDRWELPLIADNPQFAGVRARSGMVLCVEPSLGSPVSEPSGSGLFLIEDEVEIRTGGAALLSDRTPRRLQRLLGP
jgi:Xaa-Pro dipeptidase